MNDNRPLSGYAGYAGDFFHKVGFNVTLKLAKVIITGYPVILSHVKSGR